MILSFEKIPLFFKSSRMCAVAFALFPAGWLSVYYYFNNVANVVWALFIYSCMYVMFSLLFLAFVRWRLNDMLLFDPLTNVYNKRYFFKALDVEFSKSKRQNEPLSLVTFSLVNVKSLSGALGRSEEYIHRVFAETVTSCIRDADVFSRVDANSYTLLLSNTDDAGAQVLSRRLENLVMRDFRKMVPNMPDSVAFGICSSRCDKCEVSIDIYDNAVRAHSAAVLSERNRIMSCLDGECHIMQ